MGVFCLMRADKSAGDKNAGTKDVCRPSPPGDKASGNSPKVPEALSRK